MKMGLKKKDPEEGVPGKRASMKEVPGMDGIFKRMRKAAAVGSTALAIAERRERREVCQDRRERL